MKLTFKDKLIAAEKMLQEKIKMGDPIQIALARVFQRYAKTQFINAQRANEGKENE